ncbi:MAG TPA: hypothetical protein V6C57_26480 [Coleofasciculaceae cyanobacterium]
MVTNKTFRTLAPASPFSGSSRLSFSSRRSEFGDNQDDAKDLGTLKSSKSYNFSGDVGGKDLDFFKFKIGGRTRFSAKLKNESDGNQPIAVTVLDTSGRSVTGSNGKPLFSNIKAGKTFTLTEPNLAKGTYFLRLQSAGKNAKDEDYSLNLFTGSSSGGSSSLDDAKNLGSLSLGQTKSGSGSVGSDDTDIYKFNIGDTSRVVTRVTNNSFSNPIALTLLDQSGNVVKKANGSYLFVNVNEDQTSTLLAPTLSSGTYYLRFTSAEGNGEDYSFRISRTNATSPL